MCIDFQRLSAQAERDRECERFMKRMGELIQYTPTICIELDAEEFRRRQEIMNLDDMGIQLG